MSGAKEAQCPVCQGQGGWAVVNYVTADMASDAGEPEMVGMPMDDYVQCDVCVGGVYHEVPFEDCPVCLEGYTWECYFHGPTNA